MSYPEWHKCLYSAAWVPQHTWPRRRRVSLDGRSEHGRGPSSCDGSRPPGCGICVLEEFGLCAQQGVSPAGGSPAAPWQRGCVTRGRAELGGRAQQCALRAGWPVSEPRCAGCPPHLRLQPHQLGREIGQPGPDEPISQFAEVTLAFEAVPRRQL
jgi:hypothetical protein